MSYIKEIRLKIAVLWRVTPCLVGIFRHFGSPYFSLEQQPPEYGDVDSPGHEDLKYCRNWGGLYPVYGMGGKTLILVGQQDRQCSVT